MLAEKIMTIYPTLNINDFDPLTGTIHLRDTGGGPYIASWNHPTLLEPSQAALDAITAIRPAVPVEVEGWQAEVAMRATPAGEISVWDRVQDLIAEMPDGIEKITVQTALARGKIRRDSPMLAQLAPLVPLSEARVDDLLILADSIQA